MRGRLDDGRAGALLDFWQRRAGFGGDAARQRLAEVVCLVWRGGEVLGSSSVFQAALEPIGGWRFWIMRSLLDHDVREQHGALVTGTFDTLDSAHSGSDGDAVGLCVLLDDEQRLARPEAEWQNPRMIYAGYVRDGRQLRIAYFSDQVSKMNEDIPGGYRTPGYEVVAFEGQDRIGREDVISTWTEEGGLARREAERRLDELLLVAIDQHGALAGVSTAYLARNHQLHADMWYLRAFTASAHRKSNVALTLALASRDRLIDRFVAGEDRRGLGVVMEIENEGLRRRFPRGLWFETDFLFIGRSGRGADVRVHYFPGVHAPEPAPAQY